MGFYINTVKEAAKFASRIKDLNRGWSDFGIEFYNYPFTIKFWLLENGRRIAGFTLIQQVNCCGILVSTQTYVEKSHQGQKIAQSMMLLKEALAKEYGYSSMIATVDVGNNKAEVHILEKFGWNKVNEFVNKRTKHTLGVFVRNFNLEEIK